MHTHAKGEVRIRSVPALLLCRRGSRLIIEVNQWNTQSSYVNQLASGKTHCQRHSASARWGKWGVAERDGEKKTETETQRQTLTDRLQRSKQPSRCWTKGFETWRGAMGVCRWGSRWKPNNGLRKPLWHGAGEGGGGEARGAGDCGQPQQGDGAVEQKLPRPQALYFVQTQHMVLWQMV